MPTGYTHKLMSEGQDFKSFVMTCSRAMGACIVMRDEPFDEPIPIFEPSDYNAKAKLEAENLLNNIKAMSNEDMIAFGEDEKAKVIDGYRECIAREEGENDRLEVMARSVVDWVPPTRDHEGLKRFMLDQIDLSKNSSDYYQDALKKVELKLPVSFVSDLIEKTECDIAYHKKEEKEERNRTDSRNKWVLELRKSLNS